MLGQGKKGYFVDSGYKELIIKVGTEMTCGRAIDAKVMESAAGGQRSQCQRSQPEVLK